MSPPSGYGALAHAVDANQTLNPQVTEKALNSRGKSFVPHRNRNSGLFLTWATWLLVVSAAPLDAGELELRIVDSVTQKPLAARVQLTDARSRHPHPRNLPFWRSHFTCFGPFVLQLAQGRYQYQIDIGPEYYQVRGSFVMSDKATDNKTIPLQRVVDMKSHGWWSGDTWTERSAQRLADSRAGRGFARCGTPRQ